MAPRKMKKITIIATAALAALMSCSKIETVQPAVQPTEVDFQVLSYAVGTKASTVEFTNSDFGTYAWYNGNDGSDAQAFMVNTKVTKQAGIWKAAIGKYYWPKAGSLDFISYSPFKGTDGSTDSMPAVTASSLVYNNYTVNGEDLMYADKATGRTFITTESDSSVPTLFHHALSKVSFEFITGDPNITYHITKVELLNVIENGSLSLSLSGTGWNLPSDIEKVGWTRGTDPVSYAVINIPESLEVTSEAIDKPHAAKCTQAKDIIVLPQHLAEQKVRITADITAPLPTGDGTYLQTGAVMEGKLVTQQVPWWGMNKAITYIIYLQRGEEITFSASASDWTSGGASVLTI